MQTRLSIDGCYGIYKFTEQEQVTAALLNDLVCEGKAAGVLNIDLLIPITRVNAERDVLEANCLFQWAGTEQRNEKAQVVVYATYRHAVTRSGDGHLAIAPPTLAPTHEEQAARNLTQARYSQPLSDARLRELQAMGKQDAPPE